MWRRYRKSVGVFPKKNSLDAKALTRCLKENAIQAPKVGMDRHGAIGRFACVLV
jgi:hypothetical protein